MAGSCRTTCRKRSGLSVKSLTGSTTTAVTAGNGALVFSPAAGSSFDPEGDNPAGTTYAKIIVLKHNANANGTQLVTFDQLVLHNGVQVYPIYRSTDDGASWTKIADVVPSQDFPTLTRTAQPFLFEVTEDTGGLSAGTILLGGMIMPADRSSSTLVVYQSTDRGQTWSYLSSIDSGGPADYDPSPTSTTAGWPPRRSTPPARSAPRERLAAAHRRRRASAHWLRQNGSRRRAFP
jgi:hypothetical protein